MPRLPEGSRFAPHEVPAEFPVTEPDFNRRGDHPGTAPHLHDLFEIGYCYDGSGVFIIADKVFPFKAGDAVVINTREVHVARADPGGTTGWGFVNLDPVRLLAERATGDWLDTSRYCGSGFRNRIDGGREPEIALCIKMILEELRRRDGGYRDMVRALVWRLLLLLERREPRNREPESEVYPEGGDFLRLMPALDYISAHCREPIEVVGLARRCFMSPANFRRLFARTMGCPAKSYIINLRLNTAAALLANSVRPVLEIARICGYGSLPNFNRQFRARFGCTPLHYRRRNQ